MDNHHSTTLLAIFIVLLLIVFIFYIIDKQKSSLNEDDVIETMNTARESPKFGCDVHYVTDKYKDACNKGEFAMAYVELAEKKGKAYADQIASVAKKMRDNGVGCKLGFGNRGFQTYNEAVMDYTDTESLKSRNARDKDGNFTNITTDWAKCFKTVPSVSDAHTVIPRYANLGNGTVVAHERPVSVNGKPAARITFNNIEYENVKKAVCKLPANFNAELSPCLVLLVDNNMRIIKYNVRRYDGNRFLPYVNPMGIYKMMFTTAVQRVNSSRYNKVVIIPKAVSSCTIYKIRKDVCGRIDTKQNIALGGFNINNIVDRRPGTFYDELIDIPKRLNSVISSIIEASPSLKNMKGSIRPVPLDRVINADIQQHSQELTQRTTELDTLRRQYGDLLNNSRPEMAAGLQMRVYHFLRDNPSLQNAQDMNALFTINLTGIIDSRIARGVTLSDYYSHSIQMGVIFQGFITVPSDGDYRFLVNSDDASEVFIDDTPNDWASSARATTLATHHYGYHAADNGGTSERWYSLKKGSYYKIFVRVAQGEGGYSIELKWWKRGDDAQRATVVPNSAYAYIRDGRISQVLNRAKYLRERISAINNMIDEDRELLRNVNTLYLQRVGEFMLKLNGMRVNSNIPTSYVSTGNEIYLSFGDPSPLFKSDPTVMQDLNRDIINLSTTEKIIQAPDHIDYYTTPEYTLSMWLRVTKHFDNYRPVIFFGSENDWSEYLRTGNDKGKIDRTPSLSIYGGKDPKDGKVRVSFVHRVDAQSTNTFRPFSVGVDTIVMPGETDSLGRSYETWKKTAPDYNKWFHLAATVNQNELQLYVNGALVAKKESRHNFEWNFNSTKKMYLGTRPGLTPVELSKNSPYFIQKFKWTNRVLDESEIRDLAKEPYAQNTSVSVGSITPQTPKSIPELLAKTANQSGTYNMVIGNGGYQVYINMLKDQKYKSSKWVMIMNYTHKANTNPSLRIMQNQFPLERNYTLGTDGSTDPSSWGHVSIALLRYMKFNVMRFYATNGTKTVHFILKNKDAISYFKYGHGKVPSPLSDNDIVFLSNHNGPLMRGGPDTASYMGERAMTEFPWMLWAVKGGLDTKGNKTKCPNGTNGYKWVVVDDAQCERNTIHKIYVGWDDSLPDIPVPSGCTINNTKVAPGALLYNKSDNASYMVTSNGERLKFQTQKQYDLYKLKTNRPYALNTSMPNIDRECKLAGNYNYSAPL